MEFATVVLATISVMSLLVYDGIVVCEILGKEELVEKVWRQLLPKKKYDKLKVKGIILLTGSITYFLTFDLVIQTPIMLITGIIMMISLTKQIEKWL